MSKPTLPTKTLLQGHKVSLYHTDVQQTWRKFGWKPTKHTAKGSRK